MAEIAPGAFLWSALQLQAAQTVPGGTDTTAMEMWPGIVFALILAFFTALSYSELARIYPEAGSGSCYYFAEKAFVDKAEAHHQKWGRLAKLVTGWAAHLFYWVYPGVMVAFMATLIAYIVNQLTGATLDVIPQMVIAGAFSLIVSFIAFRGVTGSTTTSLVINAVQLRQRAVLREQVHAELRAAGPERVPDEPGGVFDVVADDNDSHDPDPPIGLLVSPLVSGHHDREPRGRPGCYG